MKENNELTRDDIIVESDMEVDSEHGTITAYLEAWFSVDKKFGTHTAEREDEWLNLYAEYSPADGSLKMTYQVENDNNCESFDYTPTEDEKQLIIGMMEECCQKYNGCSLQ